MSTLIDYARSLSVRVAESVGWLTFVDNNILEGYLRRSVVLQHEVQDDVAVAIKRAFDVLISLFMIILCWPIFLAIASLIKLTSGGPILLVQQRLGMNKRPFDLYKFRTTKKIDYRRKVRRTEEIDHPSERSTTVIQIKLDPSITWFGTFLRKRRLDELPQLINVLKGDMSLVGPRPLHVFYGEDYEPQLFSVRPGITGLEQVAGGRLSTRERLELDTRYVSKRSMGLDLSILFKTLSASLIRIVRKESDGIYYPEEL